MRKHENFIGRSRILDLSFAEGLELVSRSAMRRTLPEAKSLKLTPVTAA
jgi:hypothetical protein